MADSGAGSGPRQQLVELVPFAGALDIELISAAPDQVKGWLP